MLIVVAVIAALLVVALILMALKNKKSRCGYQPRGKLRCRKPNCLSWCLKRFRKQKTSTFSRTKLSDRDRLQQVIDQSAVEQELRKKTKYNIEHQGENDSFFAGEE